LARGEFEEGWDHYEWRWRGDKLPDDHITGPRWDGGSLAGKTIVLHTEQGGRRLDPVRPLRRYP
jgi:hypothetical protein